MRTLRILMIGMACLFSLSAGAKDTQSSAAQIARLRADLTGPQSATQILTRWCAELGLATPPVIKAVLVPGAAREPGAAARVLLKAGADQPIRYRRVQLMCGNHIFSEAENWYRPDKLTAAMNQKLDTTGTSFGTVVQSLAFHRQILAITADGGPRFILHVRALLVTGAGDPFSLVVENYHRALLSR